MTKVFCDICGKEIRDWKTASKFKIKRRFCSWHETWWEKMSVHTNCWLDLCDILKKKAEERK